MDECCHKTKERSEEEYKRLIHRLNRIEGQIRGIRGMVEKSAYCTDILAQVAAANAALNAFSKELLANHIRTCVAQDIRAGKDEVWLEKVLRQHSADGNSTMLLTERHIPTTSTSGKSLFNILSRLC